MTLFPKAIYKCNSIPTKIPMTFFHRPRADNSKICTETQRNPNSQNNLEKGGQSWRYHMSWFQTTLQSYSDGNSMALAQAQIYSPMNRGSGPKLIHLYGQLIYDKGVKNTHWRKHSLFNKRHWETTKLHAKETSWTTFSQHSQK